jgi:D-sedoheptulose 7-phosphate isomerase
MLEQRVQQQFFESADLLYQVAEQLSRPLAMAAQMLVDGVTAGGRVLCCGQGLAALDAQILAALLAGKFEQDRPGLAALNLSGQVCESAGLDLPRLIQAHGHPGDVLVLIEPQPNRRESWQPMLEGAHAQEMSVIALTGGGAEEWRGALLDTDILIRVSHARAARVVEAQRVLIHALCDAVDLQLLGADE